MPLTYKLERRFVAAVIFESLSVVSCRRENRKNVVYFGLHEYYLYIICRREDHINGVYVR